MHLAGRHRSDACGEAGNRRVRDGHLTLGQRVDGTADEELDGPPLREVGERLDEEHRSLGVEPEAVEQWEIEREDRRRARVGGEGGVGVAE